MDDDKSGDPIGPGAGCSAANEGGTGNAAPLESATNCPYCLAGIDSTEETETCPSCRAVYHRECWHENGGCAVYGCSKVPPVENRRAIEVPHSYWGQENKPCPACGQEILAAAMRCRHCGKVFSSARPQGAGEFQSHAALQAQLPSARKLVVLLFVLSVLPFTAPIAVVWGLLWRRNHGEEIAALPSFHAALSKIGLVTSIILTVLLVVMTALYVIVRGN